jgi:hypothetical protein
MKNTDPLMGAKVKSKTHSQNMFFLFFEPFFCAFGFKAEFHVDFESVGKFVKKCTKKVIIKSTLMNMSKSEKSAFFC